MLLTVATDGPCELSRGGPETVPTVPLQLETSFVRRADVASAESATELTLAQKTRRRALVVPREHGAWGMLLVPLLTGTAVGLTVGGRIVPVLLLTTAVLSLFWLRTPVESCLGASAVRVQTKEERQLVRNVALPFAAITAAAVGALFWHGRNHELMWLGMIAVTALAAQMFLKKMGRTTRMAAEVAGALALTTTAPAAYCVATGRLDERAWALWLVNWLFAADQIHFVWLRIRGARVAGLRAKFTMGWSFLLGQILLGAMLAFGSRTSLLPELTLIAFAPVMFRGFVWFAKAPQPLVVRRLGWTELTHALVFGVLLTASFCLVR